MFYVRICVKSFDLYSKTLAVDKILDFLYFLKLKQIKIQHFPQKNKKITILKSPHIDKKSREQFQIQKNKTLILVTVPTLNKSLVLSEILKNTLLIGVEIEIIANYFKYLILVQK